MNALRPASERELGQKVVFRVQHLRVIGDWALARVFPQRPDGSEIDYGKTKYRAAIGEDAFDGEAEALLRRMKGRWKLLEWRFGATDTERPVWLKKYCALRVGRLRIGSARSSPPFFLLSTASVLTA